MSLGEPFLLGINYWPRRKAMYWWADFDAGEVREEFAIIRDLGLGYVRIFLLWESFQPLPDRIDHTALGKLRTVCDIAADLKLKIQPTFFTGHMSGPNWAPDWLISSMPRHSDARQLVSLTRHTGSPSSNYNIYTEPFVIEAEELQLRTVCGELRDHPAIWAWSLGNEPDLFCQPTSAEIGTRWVERMTRTIKSVDPDHPVLIGLHAASGRRISRRSNRTGHRSLGHARILHLQRIGPRAAGSGLRSIHLRSHIGVGGKAGAVRRIRIVYPRHR